MIQKFIRFIKPFVQRFHYFEDALFTRHNSGFLRNPLFAKAYKRAQIAAGAAHVENRWRVHVALWLAKLCSGVEGDFVELGTNYGTTASAIMDYLNWNDRGKCFYLVDSFDGIDPSQVTAEEARAGYVAASETRKVSGYYNINAEKCRQNFACWERVRVIEGWIPECLKDLALSKIAFLHIDLNCAAPEIAAFRYLINKMSKGSFVLLDDYAYLGFESSYSAWNELASELKFEILSLPTGQGIIHINHS